MRVSLRLFRNAAGVISKSYMGQARGLSLREEKAGHGSINLSMLYGFVAGDLLSNTCLLHATKASE